MLLRGKDMETSRYNMAIRMLLDSGKVQKIKSESVWDCISLVAAKHIAKQKKKKRKRASEHSFESCIYPCAEEWRGESENY